MSKELKKELFNIYDIVVFKDENGITQDCVCIIGSNKEVDKIVDMIECNNHSISIYENGSYTVWEKDGEDMSYYETNKKIIHLYTLKNDNRFYEIYPTDDYSVDNANPSEAVTYIDAFIEDNNNDIKNQDITGFDIDTQAKWVNYLEHKSFMLSTIKQALLKAQEPKQYLKWEDLEFGVNKHKIKVQLNDSIYVVEWFVDGYRFKTVNFYAYVYKGNLQLMFYLQEDKKQFFNDLHLERVEE